MPSYSRCPAFCSGAFGMRFRTSLVVCQLISPLSTVNAAEKDSLAVRIALVSIYTFIRALHVSEMCQTVLPALMSMHVSDFF